MAERPKTFRTRVRVKAWTIGKVPAGTVLTEDMIYDMMRKTQDSWRKERVTIPWVQSYAWPSLSKETDTCAT